MILGLSYGKACFNCNRWGGTRQPVQGDEYVEFEQSDRGRCHGGAYDQSDTDAMATCDRWSVWGLLPGGHSA